MASERDHQESLSERIRDKFNEIVGLPPGKYPDGEPKPTAASDTPRGTLTSDDAKGLPPHKGTGIGKL